MGDGEEGEERRDGAIDYDQKFFCGQHGASSYVLVFLRYVDIDTNEHIRNESGTTVSGCLYMIYV